MGLFEDYIREVAHREQIQEIQLAMNAALYPFRPGTLTVITETLVSTGAMNVHISCANWPSLGTVIDITRLDVIRYPEDAYLAVLRLIGQHFQNIEYTNPESHIELGEN